MDELPDYRGGPLVAATLKDIDLRVLAKQRADLAAAFRERREGRPQVWALIVVESHEQLSELELIHQATRDACLAEGISFAGFLRSLVRRYDAGALRDLVDPEPSAGS